MSNEDVSYENSERRERGSTMSDTRRGPGPAAAGSVIGPLWFGGWLFTIGFAKLLWWQAILALIVWPYFFGVAVR